MKRAFPTELHVYRLKLIPSVQEVVSNLILPKINVIITDFPPGSCYGATSALPNTLRKSSLSCEPALLVALQV